MFDDKIVNKKINIKRLNKYSNEDKYEIYGYLYKGLTLQKLEKNSKFNFDCNYYDNLLQEQNKINDILLNPPTLSEGEIECPFCKSKNTYIEEKQTRSADEGFTYFIHCLNQKCRKISRM